MNTQEVVDNNCKRFNTTCHKKQKHTFVMHTTHADSVLHC